MPKYECQCCHGDINSQWELTVTPNLICHNCYIEKYGDKEKTKNYLIKKYGYKCIITDCPYKAKKCGNGLHIHRIIKGKDGGKYEPDNCIFVCQHHHKAIEDKRLTEIMAMRCTFEQIARMSTYNIAENLLDYEWKTIEEHIINLCEELGVPARCSYYDILSAVKEELKLAHTKHRFML